MKIGNKEIKTELKFKDLDTAYQNHFIKEYVLAGCLFVIAVIICIAIKQYLYILGCLLILAAYCLYLYSQIYKSLTDKVLVIEGECIDINKKENSFLGSKDVAAKTAKITVKCANGTLLTQDVPYASDYKTGVTVRIYANEGTISQINQNTYTVINPIFMHILAN